MSTAFISYAQQDQATATQVAEELRRQGVGVWFDQTEIRAGDSILERIKEGIQKSDYLIVLLSRHASESEWVQREIGVAFERFGSERTNAILPILIDDTPVPLRFADIRYVDLKADKAKAIDEIVSRIRRDCSTKSDFKEVVNTQGLAEDLAAERKIARGPEFYFTAFLSVLSIVASLIAAYPAIETTFARVPKVLYDQRDDTVSYPPSANKTVLLNALKAAGIAPAAVRIRVINKGRAPAKEVKVGANTTGRFLYLATDPPASSSAVWVQTNVVAFKSGNQSAVVELKDLSPNKPVVIDLGYEPEESDASIDVVVNGIFAERVSDISLVPIWSLWDSLKTPLLILLGGIVFAITIGVVITAARNPRLRVQLLDLLDAISPLTARVIRILTR